MAIKFVDKDPEDEPKPKKPPAPEKPAEAVQTDPPGGMIEGQLPFAKTDSKPHGRKKPGK